MSWISLGSVSSFPCRVSNKTRARNRLASPLLSSWRRFDIFTLEVSTAVDDLTSTETDPNS